jgi:hypothetical protein
MTQIVYKIIDKSGITKKVETKIEFFTYGLLWYVFFISFIELV